MWFDSLATLTGIIISGTVIYAALIFILRLSGKRTLSQLNAFDFIITVTFGSTLASTLISKDVTIADGIVALSLLVLLQFVITWMNTRFTAFRRLTKAQPSLLLFQGRFLDDQLKQERIHKKEVLAALRADGIADYTKVGAVILETSGKISVIPTGNPEAFNTLTEANIRLPSKSGPN
ncbi:MAG: DUF421 domain-containing protein [Pseudomonadota bacterium]